jgi:hypothetical protein
MANVEIISVHIPKTAGTTFRNLLIQHYGINQVCTHYPDSPEVDGTRNVTAETKVVHGHFFLREYLEKFPQAKKIAWVRHPITRLISHYFYNKKYPHTIRQDMNQLSLADYAEFPWKQNEMTKHLKGIKLSDYYFIGVQEFFTEDLTELSDKLGWFNIETSIRDNTNISSEYYELIKDILAKPKVLDKIVSLNSEDMDLYQQVLNLRAKRRNESSQIYQIQIGWQWAQDQLRQIQEQLQTTQQQLEQVNRVGGQEFFLAMTSQLNDEFFIEKVYLTYLQREPDLEGKNNYLEQLQQGISRQEVVLAIQNSEEFKSLNSQAQFRSL